VERKESGEEKAIRDGERVGGSWRDLGSWKYQVGKPMLVANQFWLPGVTGTFCSPKLVFVWLSPCYTQSPVSVLAEPCGSSMLCYR
jgi:hypothetical protein